MHTDNQSDKLTVSEIGRLGGLTTFARYGAAHFQKAGRKGQASFAAKFTSAQRSCWGTMGGRPKRRKLADMGEKGNQVIRRK